MLQPPSTAFTTLAFADSVRQLRAAPASNCQPVSGGAGSGLNGEESFFPVRQARCEQKADCWQVLEDDEHTSLLYAPIWAEREGSPTPVANEPRSGPGRSQSSAESGVSSSTSPAAGAVDEAGHDDDMMHQEARRPIAPRNLRVPP